MSREFELKFDAYKDNNPTGNQGQLENPDYYSSGGNGRNLGFVWPDGRMQFFNYSYLVTCSLDPDGGSISLEFSTHHIELKGQRLAPLFEELMVQANRFIRCVDKRYQQLSENDLPTVHEITITSKTD